MKPAIFAAMFITAALFPISLYAADLQSGTIASNVDLEDKEAKAGDIVSKTQKGIVRSSIPHDSQLFGVVVEDPNLTFGRETQNTKPVVSYGEVKVNVSSDNGSIEEGDFITSSKNPGVGTKSIESGFIIGRSLEKLEGKNGQVIVFVSPQYRNIEARPTVGKILTFLKETLEKPENIPSLLRYFFALIVGGGSFFAGFVFFGRSLRGGVDAIARNPLAKNSIQLAMILNLVGIGILSLAGVGLSIFIIFYF